MIFSYLQTLLNPEMGDESHVVAVVHLVHVSRFGISSINQKRNEKEDKMDRGRSKRN